MCYFDMYYVCCQKKLRHPVHWFSTEGEHLCWCCNLIGAISVWPCDGRGDLSRVYPHQSPNAGWDRFQPPATLYRKHL